MKAQIKPFMLVAGVMLLLFPAAQVRAADQVYTVDQVAFEGTQQVDPGALKFQLELKTGERSKAEITEAVKKLYRTGFFDQVRASIGKQAGKSILIFTVVEKPTVRKVFITGNEEIDEEDLTDIFNFQSNRFLDKARINTLKKTGEMYYQTKGYFDAEFSHSVVPAGDGQVDLTFHVKEGERFKIREISFSGLEEIDDDDLLDAMQTKRYKWWSSWLFGTGRLNAEILDNDRMLMRQYFLDNGYLDATVSEAAVDKRDDGIYISFKVSEGKEYRIRKISAAGDLIEESVEKTVAGIEIEPGDVFSASTIREDSFVVSDNFADLGYAFANVTPNTQVDPAAAEVDIEFMVDKGRPVTIDKINISGNSKTYDHVIRREIRVSERELYSGKKVKRSQTVLRRTGFFEEVNISTDAKADKDDEVDLNVNVREGSTGSFSAGAGYSSSDGALFNARLSENNLLGTGRGASINLDLGDERENLVLSIRDNRINDSWVSGSASLLMTQREFRDFDRELAGGSLVAGYPLEEVFGEWAEDLSASLKYEYLDIDITNVNLESAAPLVIASQGRSSASGLTPRLTRNTVDNPLNPTEGSRQDLSVEVTGLGGNQEYYLLDVRNTLYYPFYEMESGGKLVFSWRTRFGFGETFNNEDFPLFRRYFPGGINSVRGFENRSLGPKDLDGNEYGGSKQFVNNFELIFPLVSSAGLKAVAFYDIGEAFDDNQSIDFGELRQAYGFGFRWTSPLGPIRVEFGYPIDREPGEDSMVTLFSFGAPL